MKKILLCPARGRRISGDVKSQQEFGHLDIAFSALNIVVSKTAARLPLMVKVTKGSDEAKVMNDVRSSGAREREIPTLLVSTLTLRVASALGAAPDAEGLPAGDRAFTRPDDRGTAAVYADFTIQRRDVIAYRVMRKTQ